MAEEVLEASSQTASISIVPFEVGAVLTFGVVGVVTIILLVGIGLLHK